LHTLQHAHIVRAVAFPSNPHPTVLATGGAEKKLRIFDLSRSSTSSPASPLPANGISTNGTPTTPSYEIGPGVHGGTIKSIVWGSDPNILVTAADDKIIRWWDLRSRTPISVFELDGLVGSCELDTNSGVAGTLSVAAGKTVYFFDGAETMRLLKSVKTPYEVASVALHAESGRFVTGGSGDTWVRVYDYEGEKELGEHNTFSIPLMLFHPNKKQKPHDITLTYPFFPTN
jgi:serine-threonine kinase receptor-associated protein